MSDLEITCPSTGLKRQRQWSVQAVMAGLGYSIMPLIGIKQELGIGSLHIIPVKGLPVKSVWNLVWLKGKQFAPQVKQYIDYLKKDKDRIMKERFDWFDQY